MADEGQETIAQNLSEQPGYDRDPATQAAIDRDLRMRSEKKWEPSDFSNEMLRYIEETGSVPEDFAEKLNVYLDKSAKKARFDAMNAIFNEIATKTSMIDPFKLPENPPSRISQPSDKTQEYYGKTIDTPPSVIPFHPGETNSNFAPTPAQQEATR